MNSDTPLYHNGQSPRLSPEEQLAAYEHRLAELTQEIAIRRALNLEQQQELVQQGISAQQELEAQRCQAEAALNELRQRFETAQKDQRQLFEITLADQTGRLQAAFEEQRNHFEIQIAEQHREITDLQAQLSEKEALILARSAEIATLEQAIQAVRNERDAILNSTSWRVMTRLQRLRERLIPVGSRRETIMRAVMYQIAQVARAGPRARSQEHNPLHPISTLPVRETPVRVQAVTETAPGESPKLAPTLKTPITPATLISIDAVSKLSPIPTHNTAIEITLEIIQPSTPEDVRSCLSSLLEHTSPPYHLTILDDGTSPQVSSYLEEFCRQYSDRHVEHTGGEGETNTALAICEVRNALPEIPGATEFIAWVSSRARLTPGWLDRLEACAASDSGIGMVGPLTNLPGMQSIPTTGIDLDWAGNPLPAGIPPSQISAGLATSSGRIYPRLPYLAHFCLLLRRRMLAETGWPSRLGELTDTCQRAVQSGWQLALADDTYVYVQPHLETDTSKKQDSISRSESPNRLLHGVHERSSLLLQRQELLQHGRECYAGKRILFILPMAAAGGGANLILLAARTLRQMGLDVHIYNLPPYRADFTRAYPDLNFPVIYAEINELPEIAARYDAVVATSYITVYWAAPLATLRPDIPIVYYIQDYEPYFDEPGSDGYQKAAASYTLLPNLVRVCTTSWIADTIQRLHQVPSTVLGPSLDIDLFLPRRRVWPAKDSLRVTAMIRPSTPRRNPRGTMKLLRRASQEFGNLIEPVLFGASMDELQDTGLPLDFPFQLAGRLTQRQVASLMNEVDIFVDYSIFQGLGLTALEAMACGAAAVVPKQGGTGVFARHEQNCLVVDTQDAEACYVALQRLLTEADLRGRLERQGIATAATFFPELPAWQLLQAIFPG